MRSFSAQCIGPLLRWRVPVVLVRLLYAGGSLSSATTAGMSGCTCSFRGLASWRLGTVFARDAASAAYAPPVCLR